MAVTTNVSTQESEIHFYSGVKLDPKEEKLYIPLPPANFNYNTGKISDYWTRKEFEDEVLVPNEVDELLIDPSYYQNIGKQIQHPAPVSSFQLHNVNFVKVINRDDLGTKIFYGFISSVSYDNDYVTTIDWAVSEFYTNVFNGIQFNQCQISQAHNRLTDAKGDISDDSQFRLKESLSAGDTLIPHEWSELLPDSVSKGNKLNPSDIRFFVAEYYAADASQLADTPEGVDIGYPSQRGYIIIPFDKRSGNGVDIIDSDGNTITSTYKHKSVSTILSHFGKSGDISGDQFSVGSAAVTYGLGGDYLYDETAGTITFQQKNLAPGSIRIHKFSKQFGGEDVAIMYNSGYAKPIDKDFGKSIYKYLLNVVSNAFNNRLKTFFDAHGGIPEKLTHYVGLNFTDGDTLSGYFTIDQVAGTPNDNFSTHIYTSPHNASRTDLIVKPYVSGTSVDGMGWQVARKMTNQRPSSIPFVEDSWASYSFLNQNQMQNAKNVIDTSRGITESQNQFNRNQAGVQADQRKYAQGVANQQSMDMTSQQANQQLGMAYLQGGVNVAKGTVSGLGQGSQFGIGGAFGGMLGGAAGATAQQGLNVAFQGLSNQNTLQNQALSNTQASQMTALGNQQSLQLADNTLSFGNKIAAQTAQMQHATLQAGWNDMKLQPATVLAGGSSSEYLAQMGWDTLIVYISIPTEAVMMAVGRYLMKFGNTVNIYDYLQKYMFTRKVVNFIKADDCSITPSSNIENSTRIMLEAGFNRGFQIWHNLDKMARNDYSGNDYV